MGTPYSSYAELETHLDDGGDPNEYTNRWSLLYKYEDQPDCFELLLQRGADPNQPSIQNTVRFPICAATMYGNIQQMKLLLRYGADPNCVDGEAFTPLHRLMTWCLEKQRIYLHTTDAFLELVNLLIHHGADINKKRINGESCIDILVCTQFLYAESDDGGYKKIYNLLMKRGCPTACHPKIPILLKYWCRRKWAILKAVTKVLSLHHRAVITANEPTRLEKLGYFEIDEHDSGSPVTDPVASVA